MTLNHSILIVDDSQAQAVEYVKAFQRKGWLARAVFCGDDAVDAIKASEFGVILLDMRMPGTEEGFAALKEILLVRPDQCVVFFTAFGDVDSAVRALREGAWSMVLKDGISGQHLIETVEIALHRKTLEENTRKERDKALINEAIMEASVLRLANGCAHTVKNRLLAVGNYLELAEAADTAAIVKDRVAAARSQLGNAFFAVKRLERISKVERVELFAVRLVDAVSQAVAATKREYCHHPKSKILFVKKLNDAVEVIADKEFLAESLENVFGNSIDAMMNGGGTIELICECSNGIADIRISDTGPGFSTEMLTMAHEPFRSSKGQNNFGYGLTFAKAVVERCNGRLDYGNRLDRTGAWVRIVLPLAGKNGGTGHQ